MKALFLTVIALLSISSAMASDHDIVLIIDPLDIQECRQQRLTVLYDGGDALLLSSPQEIAQNFRTKPLALDTSIGGLYIATFSNPADIGKIVDHVSVLHYNQSMALVQATEAELRLLPASQIEWTLIRTEAAVQRKTSGTLPNTDDFDPLISEMLPQVSDVEYINNIQILEDFITRNSYTDEVDEAAAWILSQFQGFGLDAYYHEFTMGPYTKKNVIGEITGTFYPDSVYLIMAHYDATVGVPWGYEPVAPGANDNASGTAVVIECARIMSRYHFEKTVRFVAYCGEEQGLLGSFAYTDHLYASDDQIAAAFNLDMVSYCGSATAPYNANSLYNENPNSQAMANKLDEAAYTFLPGSLNCNPQYSPNSASSDHWPFWVMGWPATFTMQGYVYPYYHTLNDLTIHQNQEYGALMTQMTLAACADFAIPTEAGTYVSGNVSGIWTADGSPYIIVDSTWVDNGQTLTINPGIDVYFEADQALWINAGATFTAEGSLNDPITFEAFNPQETWGGIRFENTSGVSSLSHCIIHGTSHPYLSGQVDGGSISAINSTVEMDHCLIYDSYAEEGGAIFAQDADLSINFCTLVDNRAAIAGAMKVIGGSALVENSIIWDCVGDPFIYYTASITMNYCVVEGGFTGIGNLDVDPLFVNPDIGDFHLQSMIGRYFYGGWATSPNYSPCLDAGDPNSPFTDEPEPNGNRVNMGAYGGTAHASLSPYDPNYAFGEVSGSWTLANSPLHVIGNLTVAENDTLTIEPGVEIIFDDDYFIRVLDGAVLQALGTENDSICFSPVDSAVGWSGIQFLNSSAQSLLEYCIIEQGKNTTSSGWEDGGGGVQIQNADPVIRHCLFRSCTATQGGAIAGSNSNSVIEHCVFLNNSGNLGGAIFFYQSSPVVYSCEFLQNSASSGGAIQIRESGGSFQNNLIHHNSAIGQGGAIYTFMSEIEILNNSVCNNSATNGGGVYFIGTTVSAVRNNIIYYNDPPQLTVAGVQPEVAYNCLTEDTWGETNISDDPMFQSGSYSDYQLSASSPCIDSGDPSPHFNDPEDPGNPGSALYPALGTIRNDMGAYGGHVLDGWVGIQADDPVAFTAAYKLYQNYPNPFNPSTTLKFSIPEYGQVKLDVINIQGQIVARLAHDFYGPGEYKMQFDGSQLASGVYLLRMAAGEYHAFEKMILLK
ncbi:M28 family peptidase [bacterium]|nr:M28 family peptidase [bacterium]